jgi:hypothetical protein
MMVKRGKIKRKVKSKASKDLLLENFVLLQKTLVETATALKEVNTKIDSMLELFEEASRTFKAGKKPSTNILDRLETIEEQNQVIAKTLLLLQKQISEKEKYGITRKTLEPSIKTRRIKKIKKGKKRTIEKEEPLFSEEFGAETGDEESDETEDESSEDEEYRPKPLPEFSF